MKQIRKRLTYANVMSSIAVFVVLGGGAIAATQLPKNSVGSKQIKKNAVKTPKIANNAVNGAKIADGSVTGAEIGDGTVATGELAASAVTADKLADNAVTTNKIANDAVTGAKVNEATLGQVPSANTANSANTASFANTAGRATNVFTALVNSNGAVLSSVPAGVTATKLGTGIYEVDFNRPIAGCTWFTALGGDNFIPSGGEVDSVPRAGNENALFVVRSNSSGTAVDGDFYAELTC